MKAYKRYCVLSLLGVLLLSVYPICMGINVIVDMVNNGTVIAESYPKYIIPYTPLSLALITGAALMPLLQRMKKRSLLTGSFVSCVVFFVSELFLESQVIVTSTTTTTLESWQMYMCYIPPEGFATRTWTQVNVLMGEYSPAFKLHFYLISVVLILSILSCIYGFGSIIRTGDKSRLRVLTIQSVCSSVFLALCIFACFTAFFRTGDLAISPLSATLMTVFFVIFGVTMGLYTGTFLLGKRPVLSILLPSVIASLITLAMYIGELILLSGHLYIFGTSAFFSPVFGLPMSPFDLLTIIMSGLFCAGILLLLRKKKTIQ